MEPQNVLVYIETDDSGKATPLSLEALNAAKQAAADSGAVVSVLLIGGDLSTAAEAASFYEVEKIFVAEDGELKDYRPGLFLQAFEKAYGQIRPELTVFGNSKNGLDFAARAAVHLDIHLVADCVKIEWEDGEFAFTKPVFSNNVMAVYGGGPSPGIVTLRPKSTDASESSEHRQGEIVRLDSPASPVPDDYEIVEKGPFDDGGKNLADADAIVSGGRGMGGPEGFALLQDLADRLDAEVGATRPPCDLGWVSADAQVGITGAIVSPDLYVAVGLSGSFQHMAGMGGAKTVVAVNSDPKANIFKISDYGVVGEYEEVLPGLIEELGR
ncbi:MAG: electron transfer flavoprotein subunit alpha/FixB family protein [Proteobacteria bacterium]|nr:electron transfer flavoprotein subunit alpha/FixB family protein [Pseudomonadota bacterium]